MKAFRLISGRFFCFRSFLPRKHGRHENLELKKESGSGFVSSEKMLVL